MTFRFANKHRLKSKKAIGLLFESGKRIRKDGITLVYCVDNEREGPQIQMSFSVAKRNMRKAVGRNHSKRVMREIVRKNLVELCDSLKNDANSYNLMFLYQRSSKADYVDVEDKIILLLKRFKEQVNAG